MFNSFEGYKEPTVKKINKNCTVATYIPVGKGDIILGINTTNKDNTGIVYLYSNTLITICNDNILYLLNVLNNTKKIKNKRKYRRKK